MAVVIRLQGLRITAGSQDIRKFFTGLKIPDGGVHIIGGEREEAFIIFASDEDARRAMTRSGGVIKGGHVTLLLSSKAEMQSVLESSTKNVAQEPESPLEEDPGRPRRPVEDEQMSRRPGMRSDHVPPAWHQSGSNSDDLYVFLNGLPFSVTEKEICDFFSGLLIDDIVLVKNEKGLNNGRGFVRFSSSEDAQEGLKRDREYIGSRYVEVYSTTEADWRRAAGANTSRFNRGGSPFRSQRNSQHHIRSRSPITLRPAASSGDDYCVLLENLAFTVEKNDIKRLFRHANLEDDQILYLNQDDGRRTKSAFVLFKTLQEYRDAVACDKRPFFNRLIHVRPISREKMIALLGSESMDARSTRNPDRFQDRPPSYPRDSYESEKMCLFVQNLPFDVRKVEIMDFFLGFSITEDDVVLLRDNAGAGIGKALVVFSSEAAAMRALSLSGQRFLGSEVALKCISRSQMQEFGVEPPGPQGPGDDDFPDKSSEESFHPVDPKGPDFRVPSNRNMPMSNTQAPNYRDSDYETFADDSHTPEDGGNGYGPLGRFDGPSRQRFEGPSGRFDGPSGHRFCGASRQRFDGPSGHRFGGPTGQRFDGPSGQRFDSPSRHRFDGPSGQRFDGPSGQRFDGPTCVKLHNLPFQIRIEEIYDFCYGFQIIPGSASLQYDKSGAPQGTATVVFESRQEAFMAIEELSGRPIGPRKIQLVFV